MFTVSVILYLIGVVFAYRLLTKEKQFIGNHSEPFLVIGYRFNVKLGNGSALKMLKVLNYSWDSF